MKQNWNHLSRRVTNFADDQLNLNFVDKANRKTQRDQNEINQQIQENQEKARKSIEQANLYKTRGKIAEINRKVKEGKGNLYSDNSKNNFNNNNTGFNNSNIGFGNKMNKQHFNNNNNKLQNE